MEPNVKRLRVSSDYTDAFHHEDTTQIIISYLSEDARFCFSLTSKKNEGRVNLWKSRDVYARDRESRSFRRAYVLHDATKEGHLNVLKWISEVERVNIHIVCGSLWEKYTLLEPFTCKDPRYYYRIYSDDEKYYRYDSTFQCDAPLSLMEVAARYGKREIIDWVENVKHKENPLDPGVLGERACAMAIIGGHYHLKYLLDYCWGDIRSCRLMLQRAPFEDIEEMICKWGGYQFEVPWENLIERGNLNICKSLMMDRHGFMEVHDGRVLFCAAMASGKMEMMQFEGSRYTHDRVTDMSEDDMREEYFESEGLWSLFKEYSLSEEIRDKMVIELLNSNNERLLKELSSLGNGIIERERIRRSKNDM